MVFEAGSITQLLVTNVVCSFGGTFQVLDTDIND